MLAILFPVLLDGACRQNDFFCHEQQDSVDVKVRIVSSAVVKNTFSSINPIKSKWLRMQYRALELVVHNKSEHDIVLDASNISIPIVHPQRVGKKLRTNMALMPLIAALAASTLLIGGLGLAAMPSLVVGFTIGVVTSTVDTDSVNRSVSAYARNTGLDLTHPTVIPPSTTVIKIIFVKKRFLKKGFKITLMAAPTGASIVFSVQLPCSKA